MKSMRKWSVLKIFFTVLLSAIGIPLLIMGSFYGYFRYRNPRFHLTYDMDFSLKGNTLFASAVEGSFFWKIDVDKAILLKKLVVREKTNNSTGAISPNGRYFACGIESPEKNLNKLVVYDLEKKMIVFKDSSSILDTSFTPNNDLLVNYQKVYSMKYKTLNKLKFPPSPSDGKEVFFITLKKTVKEAFIVAIINDKFFVYRLDIKSGQLKLEKVISTPFKINIEGNFPKYNLATGGDKIFVFNMQKVIIINTLENTSTKYSLNMIRINSPYRPFCASNNGEWFALVRPTGKYGMIEVYETKTGKKLWDKEVDRKEPVVYMALSKKTGLLAVGYQRNHQGRRGRIEVYNIKTGQTIVPIMK